MKKDYRSLCKEKKRKERESWEKQIEGVKMEGQWRIINRERKKRKEEIKMEEWEGHFREVLGGVG